MIMMIAAAGWPDSEAVSQPHSVSGPGGPGVVPLVARRRARLQASNDLRLGAIQVFPSQHDNLPVNRRPGDSVSSR